MPISEKHDDRPFIIHHPQGSCIIPFRPPAPPASLEVGAALIEIRERKGYQLRGFETFEDYCEKQFGFSVRHDQRMIAAAQTVKALQAALPEQGKKAIPANEAVARALTPVAESPALVRRVAAKLEKAGTSIAKASAAQVEKVVAAVTGRANAGAGNGAKP